MGADQVFFFFNLFRLSEISALVKQRVMDLWALPILLTLLLHLKKWMV